jgi:hypothetical protein
MNETELRDYFAAAALTGLLSADPTYPTEWHIAATAAYEAADAMLKERKRDEH